MPTDPGVWHLLHSRMQFETHAAMQARISSPSAVPMQPNSQSGKQSIPLVACACIAGMTKSANSIANANFFIADYLFDGRCGTDTVPVGAV
ncbi:hypothetical protein KCX83_15620 [Brucella oryzae]|uniref:hypothetical protein n=1 Tax=Brucella oryzae TaxID=335286 RepID=UPI001B835CCC|nr:hypothetical protein [Brucella oryzae]MBR7653749.1 hypothetical protein [Brucella oryzae]